MHHGGHRQQTTSVELDQSLLPCNLCPQPAGARRSDLISTFSADRGRRGRGLSWGIGPCDAIQKTINQSIYLRGLVVTLTDVGFPGPFPFRQPQTGYGQSDRLLHCAGQDKESGSMLVLMFAGDAFIPRLGSEVFD